MLSNKLKLVVIPVAVLLSVCKATITSFEHHAHYDNYELETTDPLTHIDSKFQIRRLQTNSVYDVSHHSVEQNGKTLIGKPDNDVSTFLIFSKCTEGTSMRVMDSRLIKIDSDDTIELSTDYIRITPESQFQGLKGEKLFSYHDKVHEYYRVQHGDRSVIEHGSEYWYANVVQSCPLSVLEAAAVLDCDDNLQGSRYTEICPLKPGIVTYKVTKKASIKPLCFSVVFKLNWGSSNLIFGNIFDGHVHFPHPAVACNTDFENPIEEVQTFKVTYDIESSSVDVAVEMGGRWDSHTFDIKLTALHNYLEHIGDDSRPKLNSIGIWYGGDFDADITVKHISSFEHIHPADYTSGYDDYQINGQNRVFTKIGDLSMNPLKVVAKMNEGFAGTLCGGFGFIYTESDPHLIATFLSNGSNYCNQSLGCCSEASDTSPIRKLTLRAQMFNEFVKVGVQKDDDPELVSEVSIAGAEWIEDFNSVGFVHSSPNYSLSISDSDDNLNGITFEVIQGADDMTNLETTELQTLTNIVCSDDTLCESYETCKFPDTVIQSSGICTVFDYCREAKAKNNTLCHTKGTTCRGTYNPDGYECVCSHGYQLVEGILNYCEEIIPEYSWKLQRWWDTGFMGDLTQPVAAYLMFSKCRDADPTIKIHFHLVRIDGEDSFKFSNESVEVTPTHVGTKLLSYHDQVRGYYTVQSDFGNLSESGSDYWFTETDDKLCPLKVLKVAAALDDYTDGYRYTEISPLKHGTIHYKIKKKKTVNALCSGVVFNLNWGSPQLIFGYLTDGLSLFGHPGDACNMDLYYETPELQFLSVTYDIWGDGLATIATKVGVVSNIHTINIKIPTLYDYLEHIGDDSRPELDSIGIWYSGDFDADITVRDITSYETIKQTDDMLGYKTYNVGVQNRVFNKMGELSTSPQKFVAKMKGGYTGTLCGGFGFIDTESDPHLIATYLSDGIHYWNETRYSCSHIVAKEQLTLRAQKLNESVKVGVQGDDDPELLFEISTTGVEWYGDFNSVGFVHSSPNYGLSISDSDDNFYGITFEVIQGADDMTNLETNSCSLPSDCAESHRCLRLYSMAPRWGTCIEIVDKCNEAEERGNPLCKRATCERCIPNDSILGYECVCKKGFDHIENDASKCRSVYLDGY